MFAVCKPLNGCLYVTLSTKRSLFSVN